MINRLFTITSVLLSPFVVGQVNANDCQAYPEAVEIGVFEPRFMEVPLVGEFAMVPAGSFCMGDLAGVGEEDEQPVREVEVPAFWIARHEITRGQFAEFVRDTSYTTDAEDERSGNLGCLAVVPEKWSFQYRAASNWLSPGFVQTDRHPVVCVSYQDALAFIEWLSEKSENSFRLPTEAEWEYVARAGAGSVYPWGESPELSCRYANVADQSSWPGFAKSPFGRIDCDDGFAFTAPVGNFDSNEYGISDLHGNVWEWLSDCYRKSYAPDLFDENCEIRVFRGSSWMNSAKSLRSANRSKNGETDRLNTVGFRLVIQSTDR